MEQDREECVKKYMKRMKCYYDYRNRLIQYPSKRPQRIIALGEIAKKIDPDKNYTAEEMNNFISGLILFDKAKMIRKELFLYKIIGALKDESEYWLEPYWENVYDIIIKTERSGKKRYGSKR